MVYNEEVVYLKKTRSELMNELQDIMNQTIASVEECRKVEGIIHDARMEIISGKVSESELDDYATLNAVLEYKLKVVEEENAKRTKRRDEIIKQVLYIDELCS